MLILWCLFEIKNDTKKCYTHTHRYFYDHTIWSHYSVVRTSDVMVTSEDVTQSKRDSFYHKEISQFLNNF